MKHVINVADQRIQLHTRLADNNICDFCKQPIKKIYVNGKLCRKNREDCEDDKGNLVSYHTNCFDYMVFDHVLPVTIKTLYHLEVEIKLTSIDNNPL